RPRPPHDASGAKNEADDHRAEVGCSRPNRPGVARHAACPWHRAAYPAAGRHAVRPTWPTETWAAPIDRRLIGASATFELSAPTPVEMGASRSSSHGGAVARRASAAKDWRYEARSGVASGLC